MSRISFCAFLGAMLRAQQLSGSTGVLGARFGARAIKSAIRDCARFSFMCNAAGARLQAQCTACRATKPRQSGTTRYPWAMPHGPYQHSSRWHGAPPARGTLPRSGSPHRWSHGCAHVSGLRPVLVVPWGQLAAIEQPRGYLAAGSCCPLGGYPASGAQLVPPAAAAIGSDRLVAFTGPQPHRAAQMALASCAWPRPATLWCAAFADYRVTRTACCGPQCRPGSPLSHLPVGSSVGSRAPRGRSGEQQQVAAGSSQLRSSAALRAVALLRRGAQGSPTPNQRGIRTAGGCCWGLPPASEHAGSPQQQSAERELLFLGRKRAMTGGVMAAPYIPTTDSGLSGWLGNFATLIAADPPAYGLVAGDATAISAQNTAYQAAYALATDPSTRTAPTIAAKDAAKATALAVVRPYAMQINANSGVTDEQRGDLGLTIRKTVPTPIPAPTAVPAVVLLGATPLKTTLRTYNTATPTSKAKPYGSSAVEIFVAVGVVAAVDPLQANFVNAFSKSPLSLDWDSSQVGKVATIWGRYTTRGSYAGPALKGPWSAPLTVSII